MMKEVNDIIGELQTMLKPKIVRIQSHSKQGSSNNIPKLSLKDCVKDLWKTDFWSESISLASWKETPNNNSDLISISEYQEESEPEIQILNPDIFTANGDDNAALLGIFN